jgi:hypothetical protein
MENGKFVSYLRVSTIRQGASGLGLEAQRAAVAEFLNGGDWTLVQEVLEVESGKREERAGIGLAPGWSSLNGCRRLNRSARRSIEKLRRRF